MIVDEFSQNRGGTSVMYTLACEKCDAVLGDYQKDGPGPLKRLYVDRLQSAVAPAYTPMHVWACHACHRPLAIAMVYAKETRPCWTLFAHTVRHAEPINAPD